MNSIGQLFPATSAHSSTAGMKRRSSRAAAEKIRHLAACLDQQQKPNAQIAVLAKRASLLKTFKPRVRGGPLYAGEHELKCIDSPSGKVPVMYWLNETVPLDLNDE